MVIVANQGQCKQITSLVNTQKVEYRMTVIVDQKEGNKKWMGEK